MPGTSKFPKKGPWTAYTLYFGIVGHYFQHCEGPGRDSGSVVYGVMQGLVSSTVRSGRITGFFTTLLLDFDW